MSRISTGGKIVGFIVVMKIIHLLFGSSAASSVAPDFEKQRAAISAKASDIAGKHLNQFVREKKVAKIYVEDLPKDGVVTKDEFIAAALAFSVDWAFFDPLQDLRKENAHIRPKTADAIEKQIVEISIHRIFILTTSLGNLRVSPDIIDEVLIRYGGVLKESLFLNRPKEYTAYVQLLAKRIDQYNRALQGKGTVPYTVGPGFAGNEFISVGNEFSLVLYPETLGREQYPALGLPLGLSLSNDARICMDIFSRYHIKGS